MICLVWFYESGLIKLERKIKTNVFHFFIKTWYYLYSNYFFPKFSIFFPQFLINWFKKRSLPAFIFSKIDYLETSKTGSIAFKNTNKCSKNFSFGLTSWILR